MNLYLIELTPELAANIARGIELRRAELHSLGLTVPGLATAEAMVAKQAVDPQNGARERQDATTVDDFADLLHAQNVTPLLLTKRLAADMLSVSVRTVDRLVSSGQLPTVRVDNRQYIRRSDLEEYVAGLGPASFRSEVQAK